MKCPALEGHRDPAVGAVLAHEKWASSKSSRRNGWREPYGLWVWQMALLLGIEKAGQLALPQAPLVP